jgi:hypothetical protein
VWEGRVEEAVDVHVMLDQLIVALVVLASRCVSSCRFKCSNALNLHVLLHVLELFITLVVLLPRPDQPHVAFVQSPSQHLPLVSGVRIANQPLTSHLWRVQYGGCIAISPLCIPVIGHHERSSKRLNVLLVVGQTSSALIAANSRRAARAK